MTTTILLMHWQLGLCVAFVVWRLWKRNEVHNQIRDLFETAGLKLCSVVSELMGATGKGIIEALIRGEESPENGAGVFVPALSVLEPTSGNLEQQVAGQMAPYQKQIELPETLPGVDYAIAWPHRRDGH
jgi:hypothetical protein